MNRRHLMKASSGALTLALLSHEAGVAEAAGGSRPAATPVAGPPATQNPISGKRLDESLPVHPRLQRGMRSKPNEKVRVIVQKRSKGASGHAIAQDAGAKHVEEFGFVKAHVLELPHQAIAKLALHKDVLYVSPDAPLHLSAVVDATNLQTVYPRAVGADQVWNSSLPTQATGKGVTIAVLDTGTSPGHPDLKGRVKGINLNSVAMGPVDKHGHGTHIAGIITGRSVDGAYIGVAPDSTVLSVKIADDTGKATTTDLLRGLQWCYDNRTLYNIRVATLSITAAVPESYLTSPVCAAVEQLWLGGVVVVSAAGNRGDVPDATWYAPANDPFVITVGATDDNQTAGLGDDTLAAWSSRGETLDRVSKPDLVAPGRRIVSCLADLDCTLALQMPDRLVGTGYLRLSGTSMAAPVVAGVAALVLERYPKATPDQIKWLLTEAARPYASAPDGVPGLDSVATMAVAQSATPWGSANAGLTRNFGIVATTGTVSWSQLYSAWLALASQSSTPSKGPRRRGGRKTKGGTTTISTQAYWDQAYWDQAYWDQAYWDQAYWDQAYWDQAYWDQAAGVD